MDNLYLLAVASFVFAAMPGPSTVCMFAKSCNEGPRAAMAMAAGDLTGDLFYLTVVVLSLGSLVQLLEPLLPWLKYLAAAMLIVMGLHAIRSASRPAKAVAQNRRASGNALIGFLLCISNPKVLAYYVALLPVLVDVPQLTFASGVVVFLVVSLSISAGLCTVVTLGYLVRRHAAGRLRGGRWLRRVFGVFLIGIGGTITAA